MLVDYIKVLKSKTKKEKIFYELFIYILTIFIIITVAFYFRKTPEIYILSQ